MKKLLVALTLILSSGIITAQQKIGYIDANELLSVMPEYKKAEEDLAAFAKTYRESLETMQKELETKYKAYEEGMKAKTLSGPKQDVMEQELQSLNQRIQATQQTAEEKVGNKRADLMQPITEKANKAIQDVAKAKGYTFILDASAGGIVYAASDNILEDVKANLGIKDTPKAAPKTTPAPGTKTAPRR
jgi:outer membrane protein